MSGVRKIRVRVTFEVDVEVPAHWDDESVRLDIEENHCPGTGLVGAAIEHAIARSDDEKSPWHGACWGCPGENKIIGWLDSHR